MAKRVFRRLRVPPGVKPGIQMSSGDGGPPDGPMIYIADRAEPGVISLRRWYIPEGPTKHDRVGVPITTYSEDSAPRYGPWRQNPFGGKWGWAVYSIPEKEWKNRGLKGKDDKARIRPYLELVPKSQKVQLKPIGTLPQGDPLLSHTRWYRPWVSDECIAELIRDASVDLLFSVPPDQRVVVDYEATPRLYTKIFPIREISNVFRANYSCEMEPPKGMSLREAANTLGFEDQFGAINTAPENLYRAWKRRSRAASDKRQRLLNAAYHRTLLHRFLRMDRLTPVIENEALDAEIERRAQLIQAYRAFVFNRIGCPVGLNETLLKANNLMVKKLVDRNVHNAGFIRYGKKAGKFGNWLFRRVLLKTPGECQPSGIAGLDGLLAAVDELR